MKKRIASFDMDMTLLDHATWRIPDSARQAIERLRENYYIVIATGRDMDSKFSKDLKREVKSDAIIHLNGTKITVGDQLIYEHTMDPTLVERILAFAKDKPFAVGLSVGKEDYYSNPEYVTRHDKLRFGKSDRRFRDTKALLDGSVRTMTYIGQEEGVHSIEAEFPELKLPMFAGKQGADVMEKEASKAVGLRRLCDYLGVDLKDTVAFGDSMNDYEILSEAGIGVAMGNCIEELKSVADYITTPIQEDGIWNACVALGLFKE